MSGGGGAPPLARLFAIAYRSLVDGLHEELRARGWDDVRPAYGFALLAAAQGAEANYPNRTITLIVPFAAGGPTDVVARLLGDHMSRTLGQQLVVENIGGAGGTTGMTRVASSANSARVSTPSVRVDTTRSVAES